MSNGPYINISISIVKFLWGTRLKVYYITLLYNILHITPVIIFISQNRLNLKIQIYLILNYDNYRGLLTSVEFLIQQ